MLPDQVAGKPSFKLVEQAHRRQILPKRVAPVAQAASRPPTSTSDAVNASWAGERRLNDVPSNSAAETTSKRQPEQEIDEPEALIDYTFNCPENSDDGQVRTLKSNRHLFANLARLRALPGEQKDQPSGHRGFLVRSESTVR
jgi:hypothetical protein